MPKEIKKEKGEKSYEKVEKEKSFEKKLKELKAKETKEVKAIRNAEKNAEKIERIEQEFWNRSERSNENEIEKNEYATTIEILEAEKEKKIVIPGEIIVSGLKYLAGEGCMKEGNDIIAIKYGLSTIENNLVKVIPLRGVYLPRVGNIVIGQVVDILFNGWAINIFAPHQGFLPFNEVPGMQSLGGTFSGTIARDASEYYDIGDILVLKVKNVQARSVTLTMKEKGLIKINSGLIVKVIPIRVARIIGKKGSMVNAIKEVTKTKIVVGQNGLIWLKGENPEAELLTKKAIEMVAENPLLDGLTEKVKNYLIEETKKISKNE